MKSVIIVVALAVMFAGCYEVSSGSRTGQITKISHRGLFCKTWEGELVMGGLASGASGSVANVFKFTVEDESISKELLRLQNDGKSVTLTYREEWITGPCRSDTDYFITGFKDVPANGGQEQ